MASHRLPRKKGSGEHAERTRGGVNGKDRPPPRPGETGFQRHAEQASQEELLAGIVHTLRGPMTVIRGYSSLLRRGMALDEERRERALKGIEEATARLDRMLAEVLEMARRRGER